MANRTSLIFPENFLSSRTSTSVAVEAFLLISINFLSLCGNCLVCGAIYRSHTLRTETNLLLVALAISDILMAVIVMPMAETAIIAGLWPFGNTACQIQGYCVCMLAFVSLQLMTLTACNRYMKIVRPERYKNVFTKRKTLVMILTVTVTSAALIAVLVFTRANKYSFTFHPGKTICVPLFQSPKYSIMFTSIYAALFVVFPAVTISFCYIRILQTIKFNKGEYVANKGIHDSKSVLERQDKKLTRIVLAIILGFAACWIPCMAIDLVDISIQGFLPRKIYLAYTYLGLISSLINPILYGIMNKFIRREALKIIYCRKRSESGRSSILASTAYGVNLIMDSGSKEKLKYLDSKRSISTLEMVGGELQSENSSSLKRWLTLKQA